MDGEARTIDSPTATRRGRLKIFFGAAPGVGKTFAMLQAAQIRKLQGDDVVIGDIDTHGQPELEELTRGIETLTQDSSQHFQLEAALARKPKLLLIDDLAHSNPVGATHPQRYFDVEDLQKNGIDVYATLSVQNVDSMRDLVAQITGCPPAQSVPDHLIETADEVALVDVSAEDLLQRVRTGKISHTERSDDLFRKGNLLALRELALRATADRIDSDLQSYRQKKDIGETWAVRERVLVCVGPNSEFLVRAAKRAATRLRGDWIAVYVETPGQLRKSASARGEIVDALRLAERLGAETVTLTAGQTFAEEVLELAHSRNVTRIMVGKPHRLGWRRWLLGSVVDALVEGSGNIDVQVVGSDAGDEGGTAQQTVSSFDVSSELGLARSRKSRWRGYASALAIVALCTLIAYAASSWFSPTTSAMLYLLGVVVTATRFGRSASMVAALTSVAAFDYFFVPPVYSFRFRDAEYLFTAAVLLIVGVVISTLAANLKLQVSVATHRERRTAALYRMNREMATATTLNQIAASVAKHILDVFDAKAVLLTYTEDARLQHVDGAEGTAHNAWRNDPAAEWTAMHGKMSGLGTDTYSQSEYIYLPLRSAQGVVGVLAIWPHDQRRFRIPEQLHLLEAFASQISLAVEREQLSHSTRRAELVAQEETLRSSLLASISHDLRTPLAAVIGTASTLMENDSHIAADERQRLLHTMHEQSQHIARVFTNLLEMTRLESATVKLNKQWQMLEEIVGAALGRLKTKLAQHVLKIEIAPDVPLLFIDGVLFETLLVNLLENASKYTPPGATITVSGERCDDNILVRVTDTGPGIPPGTETKLFEKFYRGKAEGSVAGAGLGLSICRAIAIAHDARITAKNLPQGGAQFTIALPFIEPPQYSVDNHDP